MSFLQMPLNRQERRRRQQRQNIAALRPKIAAPPADGEQPRAILLPAAPLTIEQQALIELIGQPPVIYHRMLVDVCGGLTPAIWCSLAMRLTSEQSAPELTFHLSAEECQTRTGMTRREQDTARAKLRDLGLLEQQRIRHGMVYRLNLQALDRGIESWLAGPRGSQSATGTHG